MRIVIDVSPLSHPRTGIGNYLRGMVGALAEVVGADDEIVAFAPTSAPGKRRIVEALSSLELDLRLHFLPLAHAWRTAWSRLGRPNIERLVGTFDVLHFSDWMYPPQAEGIRATTVHDLVPLRFPKWVTPRTRRMHGAKYANAARTCDVIFTNSAFTARDVVERLGVAEERVRVAYPGVDGRFRPEGDRSERERPYVLTVGTLEPRKNLAVLISAFERFSSRHPHFELVVVGPVGWGEQPRLEPPGVVYAGFVSDAELARLYRSAAVFAYPSRFEGFGMPVIEALASGVPSIVSSHPSLDEASGEAALRANFDSVEDFDSALERAVGAGDEVRAKGLEHARRFTWDACGRSVLQGYLSATDRKEPEARDRDANRAQAGPG